MTESKTEIEIWGLFKKYCKGKDMIEEFSYSNYFHSHPTNRFLHYITLSSTFFLLGNSLQ